MVCHYLRRQRLVECFFLMLSHWGIIFIQLALLCNVVPRKHGAIISTFTAFSDLRVNVDVKFFGHLLGADTGFCHGQIVWRFSRIFVAKLDILGGPLKHLLLLQVDSFVSSLDESKVSLVGWKLAVNVSSSVKSNAHSLQNLFLLFLSWSDTVMRLFLC